MADKRTKAENFLRHLSPLQGILEVYCRRALRNRSDVPDVLQSAVGNAYRDFHLYAEGTNFRAWVFRYVHLEILNWNRKAGRDRREELPSELSLEESWEMAVDEPAFKALLEDPDPILERCDDVLAAAILALPGLERSVFLLHAIGEFKYREIAEILQIPIGTVMSSLSRCRLRLRERLVRFGEELRMLRRDSV